MSPNDEAVREFTNRLRFELENHYVAVPEEVVSGAKLRWSVFNLDNVWADFAEENPRLDTLEAEAFLLDARQTLVGVSWEDDVSFTLDYLDVEGRFLYIMGDAHPEVDPSSRTILAVEPRTEQALGWAAVQALDASIGMDPPIAMLPDKIEIVRQDVISSDQLKAVLRSNFALLKKREGQAGRGSDTSPIENGVRLTETREFESWWLSAYES